MGRVATLVAGIVVACGLVLAPPAMAQKADDSDALNAQVIKLYREGKYAEAIPLAQHVLAMREKARGPEHAEVATALNDLGALYEAQGHYKEAEPLYKRALAMREKTLGPNAPDVAATLNNLAGLYRAEGRYGEAEPLYKRSLAIRENVFGPDHPLVATALNHLAALRQAQGHYAEAERLYKRSLGIGEKAYGSDHPNVAMVLNNLGEVYRDQGRYGEAEPLYKRAISILETALGSEHPHVAAVLSNMAELLRTEGRYDEAEPLYKRSLAIREKALGPNHLDVAKVLNNLAGLYWDQGRYGDAEPLQKRDLAISEKALGPDNPQVAVSLNSLALLYRAQGRYADAETLYRRALAIREKTLDPDHPDVAVSLNNLAELYESRRRYAEAEPLYKRSLAIRQKAFGPEYSGVATALNNLAGLYYAEGRYADAEPLYEHALAIYKKAFGPNHPLVGTALGNLGLLYFVQRDWVRATDFWRRSTSVIVRRSERGSDAVGQAPTAKRESEAVRSSWQFWGLVKSARRTAAKGASVLSLADEMFQTAQWAQSSEAAASLAQMAARGATGDRKLALIVRERQDLVSEWQRRDKARVAAASQPPDKRDKAAEEDNTTWLTEIDTRIGEIDKRLAKDFPDYTALVSPKPLSLPNVQSQLHDDEALVLFLDTPQWGPTSEETFVWAITKTASHWVRSEMGMPSLKRAVATLRCGLDYDGSWGVADSRCAELLKATYSEVDHENGKPLPFDLARAYALYQALFGQVEDLIMDKQLLIVPSGALTQLPFQVLVTEKPDPALGGAEALRSAAWLIRSHALTVLPSVSSLRALRQLAKASQASRPLIGFGNPLLVGPSKDYQDAAMEAQSKQSCPKTLWQQVASVFGERRGVLPLKLRGGMADVVQIRSQVPLPETANELCAVARDLGVSGDDIRLGARATETEIKQLSQSGELAKYSIVHFATHGALGGQVGGDSEPGLLLTPPDQATETDDGYLAASEVTALKLDADWVILSACNTAAGGAEGAEALSGLARAFFYAGDRALLVSHWSVYSDATVKLITGAMSRIAADKSVGRAKAMRQSMLALIDKGDPREAQPAYWAPFVVVGEGAAPSR